MHEGTSAIATTIINTLEVAATINKYNKNKTTKTITKTKTKTIYVTCHIKVEKKNIFVLKNNATTF